MQRIVYVVHPLGHVDVEAGPAVVGLDHGLKGLVGDGEQGVTAEHGLYHVAVFGFGPFGETGVLLDGLGALLRPVPLRDLVAQTGPHTQLGAYVLDGEQGAGNLPKGGVEVKNGGHAVPDAVQDGGVGAGAGAVQGQMPVDVPPLAVQDLEEIGGVKPVNGQPPGQAGINVRMDVDEAGHNHPAPGVHKPGLGILGPQGRQGTGFPNRLPLQDHRAVLQVGVGLAAGDEPAVSDEQHVNRLLFPDLDIKKASIVLDGHRIARRSAAGGTFNVRSARAHSTTLQPELGGMILWFFTETPFCIPIISYCLTECNGNLRKT